MKPKLPPVVKITAGIALHKILLEWFLKIRIGCHTSSACKNIPLLIIDE
jgi:hypothetical protein